ncbi:hypothetical protein M885DRAFT_539828 [Pelagophyceae sp. CCMP2097]|nr:hypothetical protein M885DRAFT_539828 [Pelagophyceae sp. CCMP2097]
MSVRFEKGAAAGFPVHHVAAKRESRYAHHDDAAADSPRFADDQGDSPRALAAKYGVAYDAESDDDGSFGPNSDEGSPSAAAEGAAAPVDGAALMERVAALRAALQVKTSQLQKMGVLLEACEPVPGVHPDKLLAAYGGADGALVDMRDAKIVQLARKSRGLALALQRERDESQRSAARAAQLGRDKAALEEELEARRGLGEARRGTAPAPAAAPPDDAAEKRPSRRETQLHKAAAELRAQLAKSRDDVASLRRALHKEVGDDADRDRCLDDGWRGRAQQIIKLRARVHELEDGRANSPNRNAPRRRDVDAQAREGLRDMEADRQRAVEELTEQHAQLITDVKDARRKAEAAKARAESLGSECARGRDNVKTLLSKTDADDELIDALRSEVRTLREKCRDAAMRTDAQAGDVVGRTQRALNEVELSRLRRENSKLELQLERAKQELRQREPDARQHLGATASR